MPRFTVNSPTGKKIVVNAPEGATPEQVIAYAQASQASQLYYEAHARGDALGVHNALRFLAQHHAPLQPATAETRKTITQYAQDMADAGPIPNTVAGSVEGAALGAVHNFNTPTFGVAQLGLEGAANMAHVFGSHALDAAEADYKQWLAKREADYQQVTRGNIGSDVGGVAGAVAPFVMGTGALRAAGMLPKAETVIGKAGSLLGAGAAMGAAQPVTGAGSFAGQKAAQAGEGALAALAFAGIGAGTLKAIGGVHNALRLLTKAGRQTLAGKWLVKQLNAAGLDPDKVATALENAKESVPGEGINMVQGAPSVEVGQIHNFLKDNPKAQVPLKKQELAANEARMHQVRTMGRLDAKGNPITMIGPDGKATDVMELAKKARGDKWKRFEDTTLNPSNPASWVSPKEAIDAINATEQNFAGVKAVESALNDARGRITAGLRGDGRIPARTLRAIVRSIEPNLQSAMSGAKPQADVVAGLATIRHAMGESLDRQVPGYAEARAAYRADSAPINDMEAGRKLHAKAVLHAKNTGGNTKLTLADVNAALRDDAKAPHKVSPGAKQTLMALQESKRREGAAADNLGRPGSATAQSGELFKMFRNPWAMRLVGGMAVGGAAGAGMGEHFGRNPYEFGALGAMGLAAGLNPAIESSFGDVLTREGELAASAPEAAAAIRQAQARGDGTVIDALRGIASKFMPFDATKPAATAAVKEAAPAAASVASPVASPAPAAAPVAAPRPASVAPRQTPGANNASGESSASLEAQGRVAEEKSMGRQRAIIRANGQVIPLYGVDAVDAVAQPGDVVVQRGIGADPSVWIPLSTGRGVSNELAQVRIRQALPKLNAPNP